MTGTLADRILCGTRWYALLAVLGLGVGSVGCDKTVVHGSGIVYVWNGTDYRATLKLQGRTPVDTELRPYIGKLYSQIIAGPYTVFLDDSESFNVDIVKDEMTLLNVDGEGCFARFDVAGLYGDKDANVKVLDIYAKEKHFHIRDQIGVMPGKRLPATKPKSPFGFQRLAVIPCELVDDRNAVASFVRRLR